MRRIERSRRLRGRCASDKRDESGIRRPQRSPMFHMRKARGMNVAGRNNADEPGCTERISCVKTGKTIVTAKVMNTAEEMGASRDQRRRRDTEVVGVDCLVGIEADEAGSSSLESPSIFAVNGSVEGSAIWRCAA